MSNGEGGQKTYPHSLSGILQMSTAHSNSDYVNSNVFEEMSEERRQWLAEALSSIAADTDVKKMMACIQVLEDTCDENTEDDVSMKEEALEDLSMLVDNIDNANDFEKIGGFQVLLKYLSSKQSCLRWRAAEILATCVQNNPYCQHAAVKLDMIPVLNTLLRTDQSEQVRIKALYAVSCTTRDFQLAEDAFLKADGFLLLSQAMQAENEKLVTKSAFMLLNMLTTNPSHKETLLNMGFIQILVGLLQGVKLQLVQEHIVNLLVNLVTCFEPAAVECRRPELDLENTLQRKISFLKDEDPEKYKELIFHCYQLLQICFGKDALKVKVTHDMAETCHFRNSKTQ